MKYLHCIGQRKMIEDPCYLSSEDYKSAGLTYSISDIKSQIVKTQFGGGGKEEASYNNIVQ